MADPITPQISDRICKHMNEDHADAVALYAKVYAGATETAAARMVAIDPQGMDLAAEINGETVPLRVQFDHELQDSEDAHHTLIAMVKQARTQPGS
jgi:putative heme iron utilization protein